MRVSFRGADPSGSSPDAVETRFMVLAPSGENPRFSLLRNGLATDDACGGHSYFVLCSFERWPGVRARTGRGRRSGLR